MGSGFSMDKIPSQEGKVIVITGANTGIGEVCARELARHGAHVILACRSRERTEPTIERIKSLTGNEKVEFMELDLASIRSVDAFAKAFLARNLPLHTLINNAGIMMAPYRKTVDGLESQWGTNHVGHFALTMHLLPVLEATAPSRVVVLSSLAHTMGYSEGIRFDKVNSNEGYGPVNSYGQSKLMNLLFAKELARRMADKQVYVNAVHPGYVDTELTRNISDSYGFLGGIGASISGKIFAKSPDNGALTSLYVATSPEIESENYRGRYFVPYGKLGNENQLARDEELAKKLWTFTEETLERVRSEIAAGTQEGSNQ